MVSVDGDIRKEQFGIHADIYDQLTREVTQIIHSAADVRFNQPIEKIRAINVRGTQHICDLAEDCRKNNPRFSQLNYIGTAFVAGRKTGIAGEDDSLLIGRTITLQRQIDSYNDRIEFYNTRLERERERLLKYYYNLELAISKIQASQSALAALSPLPPLTSSSSSG